MNGSPSGITSPPPSSPVPIPIITQAFGYQAKATAYGTPGPAAFGASTGGITPGMIAIIIIGVLVFGMAACGACLGDGDGSSSSGGVRGVGGSSSGGFGGK